MKYLRYMESSESEWREANRTEVSKRVDGYITGINDMLQTIRDILLPISDLGYKIRVSDNTINSGPVFRGPTELRINVVSYKDQPLEITDEVKEDFIRLYDYLESMGYIIKVSYTPKVLRTTRIRTNQLQSLLSSSLYNFNDFLSRVAVVRDLVFIAS